MRPERDDRCLTNVRFDPFVRALNMLESDAGRVPSSRLDDIGAVSDAVDQRLAEPRYVTVAAYSVGARGEATYRLNDLKLCGSAGLGSSNPVRSCSEASCRSNR